MRQVAAIVVTIVIGSIGAGLGVAQEGAAPTIPGTAVPIASLGRGLPWSFEVDAVERFSAQEVATVAECVDGQRIRLRSTEPVRRTAEGALSLRVELTSLRFDGPDEASRALDDVLAGADPDTGLSYAWDVLVMAGDRLHHLHAECALAERHVEAMAAAVEAAVAGNEQGLLRAAWCRCGGGCRARR